MGLDSRLCTVNADLAERISDAPERVRRQVAATAAIQAIAQLGLDSRPDVIAGLNALNENQFGDTPVRSALSSASIDEEVASFSDEDSPAGTQHRRSAQALRSLAYALEADSERAAHNATYEAYMTTVEIRAEVRQRVLAILDGPW